MTCSESDSLWSHYLPRQAPLTASVCLSVSSSSSRFTAEEELDLEAPLTAMGIKNIFSQSKADFRHLSEWQLSVHQFILCAYVCAWTNDIVGCWLRTWAAWITSLSDVWKWVTIPAPNRPSSSKPLLYYHHSCFETTHFNLNCCQQWIKEKPKVIVHPEKKNTRTLYFQWNTKGDFFFPSYKNMSV